MNRCFNSKRACLVLTVIMSFGVWDSASAQSFPETIPLPNGFQPEGITLGNGHTAYVGSLNGGSIVEVDLRTGTYGQLVPGIVDGPGIPGLPSQIAVGLDFDPRSGYLFVAGGIYGDGRVYNTETGDQIAQLYFDPPNPFDPFDLGWINDVVVTRDAAYFTNSFVPEVYKVPLNEQGEPSGAVSTLTLHGDWQNWTNPAPTGPADMWINANGIVATPDGRALIVINYFTGLLYIVDPETGHAAEIGVGGAAPVQTGDGLVLRGKTLYVVQNFANAIAVFTLSPDYSAATFTGYLTDGDLLIPSTADLFGPWLYAVNARFDICFPGPCPGVEYDIVRVEQ